MTAIYGDFGAATGVANPFLYNQYETALLSTGQLTASLLDDTGTGTGVGLHIDTAFSTEGIAGTAADTGVGDFTEAVLDGYARTGNGTSSVFRFSGLPSGATYTLQLIGATGSAGRDTQYTVEGISKDYILGPAASPTAATSFTGTIDGDGEIIVTVEKAASGSFYGYLNGFILEYTAPTGLTIDSTDATMQRNTNFQVVCSTPTTAPTTGNTTLTNGNDTLTPSSVTGSDPYTLTFPVGDLTKQVDATGYDWTLTVDAETATTGNIPLAIQADYTLVDLVDPVTTNASLLFGVTGDTPVTGDHLEYDITSTLDSGVTLSVAASGVWTITEAVDGDWVTDITVSRRVVQADGTIGTEAVVTLSAPTSATSGLTIVTDMVSNIVSNMVN